MEFRFLFVDDRGKEVYVPSLEALADHVRSGALREEALLYDALTREWAPARAHPAFRVPTEDTQGPSGSAASPTAATGDRPPGSAQAADGAEPVGSGPPSQPLPELEPLSEDESGVDHVQAFFEDRERERREESRERDRGDINTAPFLAPDGTRTRAGTGGWGDAPPQPGEEGYAAFRGTDGSDGADRQDVGAAQADAARELLAGAAANARTIGISRRRRRPAGSNGIVRWVRRTRARSQQRSRDAGTRQAVLLAVLILVGGWGIADSWGVSPLEATDLGGQLAEAAARASGPLAPSMEAAKSGAFEDMVRGMEALRSRMRVDEPPESWMGGPYLANALGFPEVRAFWTRYLEYVEALEGEEEELFRSGFMARLQSQGIAGPVLSIRLARALRDFRADRPRRNEIYGGMEELADAAIDLHDFLVENTDRITYAPVDQGVTDDPILEAVAEDEDTREELWDRLERLADALDRVAGEDPLERRDVSRRVLGDLSIPDAVPER
ncbi:MAG TPA: hypothetical protein VK858_02910 [Longimicrobiales bacterium]|nr:hypothetical protein [Longimicrobiales bacterium]